MTKEEREHAIAEATEKVLLSVGYSLDGICVELIEHLTKDGFLELKKGSDGREYLWYLDVDLDEACICIETGEFLTQKEIVKYLVESANFKMQELKNGHLYVPNDTDWIVLTGLVEPKEAEYVGVVEFRNSIINDSIPHFLFFADKPINRLDAVTEEYIKGLCIAKMGKLRRLFNTDYGVPAYGIFQLDVITDEDKIPEVAVIIRESDASIMKRKSKEFLENIEKKKRTSRRRSLRTPNAGLNEFLHAKVALRFQCMKKFCSAIQVIAEFTRRVNSSTTPKRQGFNLPKGKPSGHHLFRS